MVEFVSRDHHTVPFLYSYIDVSSSLTSLRTSFFDVSLSSSMSFLCGTTLPCNFILLNLLSTCSSPSKVGRRRGVREREREQGQESKTAGGYDEVLAQKRPQTTTT